KGAERMHEIAGLLRGREADGQVVAGHRGGREVGEGLEEMRGDGRAGERDQDVREPGQPFGETHVGWSSSAQCWATSSIRRAAVGTGSIGPTTEMWRMTPSLSTRKTPCSTAVMAWWWSRRRKFRFMTSSHAPRTCGPASPCVNAWEKLTRALRVASSAPRSPRPYTA